VNFSIPGSLRNKQFVRFNGGLPGAGQARAFAACSVSLKRLSRFSVQTCTLCSV
jgi:hypothetical protein